jgi:hypothetical protein
MRKNNGPTDNYSLANTGLIPSIISQRFEDEKWDDR